MYYVYIIQSIDFKYRYIGYTSDYKKRLKYHNKGSCRSTKPYRHFKIVFLEEFANKKEAKDREVKLKSYKGGEALKKLLSCGGGVVNRTSL